MTVLFVNRTASDAGGAECYMNATGRMLRTEGHSTFLLHDGRYSPVEDAFDRDTSLSALWDNEIAYADTTRSKVESILNEISPDVVYLHDIENGEAINHIAKSCFTVKYMHSYKTVDPDGKMLLKDPLEANTFPLSPGCFLRAFTRKSMPRNPVKAVKSYTRAAKSLAAVKNINKVLVASEHMRGVMEMNGIDKGKIEIIPYFVDYDKTPPEIATEPNRILFAGRIAEGKGLEVLMEALSLVKEGFMLDIVGDGPMTADCHRTAAKYGLSDRITFQGWVGHDQLPMFYSRASFLVVPSVWPEPFGIGGIEAAFFGNPSIAFNVGGISDWLKEDETGYLISPYDTGEMASKISEFLAEPEKARQMGQKARERVKELYTPERHISKLLEIFGK